MMQNRVGGPSSGAQLNTVPVGGARGDNRFSGGGGNSHGNINF